MTPASGWAPPCGAPVTTETRTETTLGTITPMWIREPQVSAEAPGFEPGRGFRTPTALAVRRSRIQRRSSTFATRSFERLCTHRNSPELRPELRPAARPHRRGARHLVPRPAPGRVGENSPQVDACEAAPAGCAHTRPGPCPPPSEKGQGTMETVPNTNESPAGVAGQIYDLGRRAGMQAAAMTPVDRAESALRDFRVETLADARRLLPSWAHYRELSELDVRRVL